MFVWGGVNVGTKCDFIGKDVNFDTVAPEKIYIGDGCVITTGTIILTHYLNTQTGVWYTGDVKIGDNVFIGARTVITKPVTIGGNAVVGAGSIVTKDIPANEIWAGNPARFIRKRELL